MRTTKTYKVYDGKENHRFLVCCRIKKFKAYAAGFANVDLARQFVREIRNASSSSFHIFKIR